MIDYKKLYEDLVDRIKRMAKAQPLVTKKAIEMHFPEIVESEDEKIRKELIAEVKEQIDCIPAPDCRDKEDDKALKRLGKWLTWLEKHKEENLNAHPKLLNNGVKSKFKVGDWVVYKNDICQIVKREEGCNKLITNFGIEKELINERNLSTARLWTIQDAKAGDVLVASDGSIFLFKNTIDCACKHYVALTTDGVIKFNEGLEHYWETSIAVHPATKEQSDLLFQKMKETGYEWDAEHKQLKKIEPNPSWNEEDEEIINKISIAIAAIYSCSTAAKVEKWLKSLKERYTWKPSEHQIASLKAAINVMNASKCYDSDLVQLLKDLEKLYEKD